MRTIFFFVGLVGFFLNTQLSAQISTPPASPFSKVEQVVGLSEITIEYSRPGVKGREIFGDLVPYDKIWRTGANASTKITFSDNVTIGGLKAPKGTYAIYSIPGESEWTIMLYKDLGLGGGVARYDEANELGRFKVNAVDLPFSVETMTISVGDITNDGAHVQIMWDKTYLALPVKVEVDKRVMAAIDNAMAGPSKGEYYQAALYYYNTDRDMGQALEWINKALEDNERFWNVTWKARILGKMGNKKEAIATSKKALALAEKANNADYVKINNDLIASWK
ncbi:MAG: DUF2911 domain-containing protein [Bacteroidota bacterium]